MPVDVSTDAGRGQIAQSIAGTIAIGDVPLVVATPADQDSFIAWFQSLIGGGIVSSQSAYPCSRFLDSLDAKTYLFVKVQDAFPDDLYLLVRDYAFDRSVPLTTPYGTHDINPDHRLIVFVTSTAFANLAEDLESVLRKVCHVVHVSSDAAEPARREPHVFDDIHSVTSWCERYYNNGRFLFRGQTRDWPILGAPLLRMDDGTPREAAAQATERFLDWLSSGGAPLDVKVSEDDALAVAQHHGFKTTLLDLTRNARVAAFFATHDIGEARDQPGVIYLFSARELKERLSFGDDLAKRLGRGLLEPRLPYLRRIRNQQGVFIECKPWLTREWLLAPLRFRHPPEGARIEERVALPREFIYPAPSKFERVVNAYRLIASATGGGEPGPADVFRVPAPSFDSSGFVARRFLDERPPQSLSPIRGLVASLDGYAAIIAQLSSHLFVHANHYSSVVAQAAQLLAEQKLERPRAMDLAGLLRVNESHMSTDHPTRITTVPGLSIRDLVDSLAVYHNVRGGNPAAQPHQIERALESVAPRVWSAYRCADHWLGGEAWEAFPVAAAFALDCVAPVQAFLEAIRQFGLATGEAMRRIACDEMRSVLAVWTGHDPVAVSEVTDQMPVVLPLQRMADRSRLWLAKHPELGSLPAAYLYQLTDQETISDVMPQFEPEPKGMRVFKHDKDLGAAVMAIEDARSIVEGLAGLESTMACAHEACPYHRFRICGRVPYVPADFAECEFKRQLEEVYGLTAGRLDLLAPDTITARATQ